MAVSNGLTITFFIVIITALAVGYGLGAKRGVLPFSAEVGFSEGQWSFLRWWVKLALIVGVLLPLVLWAQTGAQSSSPSFWRSYLLVLTVQLLSERVFSKWLVSSVVVPLGFSYTAFRLWQLLDGFTRLSLSGWAGMGFVCLVLFWGANGVMLMTVAIPTVYEGRRIHE
ncbi:MAG: hypothetical protein N5P05_000430 [Chroococcopsis gigantea SAG 12.99]|nr:hypothetical protein [Chroococcopsis gigantea SAG 12.99]